MEIKPSTKGVILLLLWPEPSAYNASFKFSRLLVENGYRVIYTGMSDFKRHVLNQGFEFHVIAEIDYFILKKMRENRESRLSRWLCRKPHPSSEEYLLLLQKLEEYLTAHPPDLVLLHPSAFDYSIPFLKLKIPIIGINNELASVFNTGNPPVFSGIIPRSSTGWISRVRNFLAWVKLYRWYCHKKIVTDLDLFFSHGMSFRNFRPRSLVKKYGGGTGWGEYGPRLKVPEIFLSPPELDFPGIKPWTPRVYAGLVVEKLRGQRAFNWDKLDKNKPLVYLSLGSHSDLWKYSKNLYYTAVDAFRERPHWQLILQTTETLDREKLNPLPDNVILAEWVPQVEILSRAFLFITHGGISSIREAIYAGVPMIVFPCALDQPGNAARVLFHHLGLRGNIKEVNPKILGTLMERIAHDHSFRDSVQQIRQTSLRQPYHQKGIDFIDSFILETGTDKPLLDWENHPKL